MSTDIVITYRKPTSTAGGYVATYSYNTVSASEPPATSYDPVENLNPDVMSVRVNVKIENSATEPKAKEAAENIAATIATLIQAAAALPPSTPTPVPDGSTITAGQVLSIVQGTSFIVSDQKDFANRAGVGAADRGAMTDTVYYGSFVTGVEPVSYADADWQGQGLLGIILHEVGHISLPGFDNLDAEDKRWRMEMAARGIRKYKSEDFYTLGRPYHLDDENFAHAFALRVGGVLGIDLNVFDRGMVAGGRAGPYVGPDSLYFTRRASGFEDEVEP